MPRAITIRQPWAGLVAGGAKTVENRVRPTPWHSAVGDTLGIHAGLSVDSGAWALPHVRRDAPALDCTVRGALLGTAVLLGVHEAGGAQCRCSWNEYAQPDAWHLVFGQAQRLWPPVPMRGALGLWSMPAVENAGDGAP